ncbi:MAG: DUF2490 domain-containing protein [Cyclobacteriaceae bacterium]
MFFKIICCTTLLTFMLTNQMVYAQSKKTTNEPMIWFELIESIKLNDRFSATLLYQHRTFLDREETYQNIYWVSGNMKLTKPLTVTAGLIYFQYHKLSSANYLTVPEVRPFQAISYTTSVGSLKMSFRYMLEERYLSKTNQGEIVDGHNFNFRQRTRLRAYYPISEHFKLELSEEFFLNGQQMETDLFSQNRASMRVHYNLGDFNFNIGYLDWLVNTTNELQHRHTLLVGMSHKI